MEKEKKQDIVQKGQTTVSEVQHVRADRIIEVPQHEMIDPPLTVPDLEDSISAMLARRVAGVKTEFNSLSQRNYPVDPNTFSTALDMVKNYTADLTKKRDEQERQIEQTMKELHDQKEREKAERKAFEEFKKNSLIDKK